MIQKIKDYIQYRKNKTIVKRELAKTGAAVLPSIREFSEKKSDIIQFVIQLADSCKNLSEEELLSLIIEKATDKLAADRSRNA